MDLIMTFKIFNGTVLVNKDYVFTMNTSYDTRSNQFKICKKFNKTARRRTSFSQKIINKWNSLPYEVATSSNILSFKSRLIYVDHFLCNEQFLFEYFFRD